MNKNRARLIALWILDHTAEINQANNIKIQIDCSGPKLSVELSNRRSITTDGAGFDDSLLNKAINGHRK